ASRSRSEACICGAKHARYVSGDSEVAPGPAECFLADCQQPWTIPCRYAASRRREHRSEPANGFISIAGCASLDERRRSVWLRSFAACAAGKIGTSRSDSENYRRFHSAGTRLRRMAGAASGSAPTNLLPPEQED